MPCPGAGGLGRPRRTPRICGCSRRRCAGTPRQGEPVQLDADRKYWSIAVAKKPHLRAIVYVVDGVVERIRGVDPDGPWIQDARGYWDIPVTAPLTADEPVAEQLAVLGIRLGSHRPHVQGKMREYVWFRDPHYAGRASAAILRARGGHARYA